MQIGPYAISIINHGNFKLDGGAMFGSVPKNLWSRLIASDQQNRIALATNSLLIEGLGKSILVDLGMGDKWSDKQKEIFAIEPNSTLILPKITDIILTHLHFDHAGGVSKIVAGKLELAFPSARIWLQRANYQHASNPGIKERASYLKDNIEPLKNADLHLVDGDQEIFEHITVHRIDGHTIGQQWIEISAGYDCVYFPSDLIPTMHHVPLAYHLGYDLCADTAIKEKAVLLDFAVDKNAYLIFQHDSQKSMARVAKSGLDNFRVADCS